MSRRRPNWLARTVLLLGMVLLYAGVAQAAVAGRPASITVPLNNPNGSYTVQWAASLTPGVTYALEEAFDAAFTLGLRTIYNGKALRKTITMGGPRYTPGKRFFYRVKARKAGFTDSGWRMGGNGCRILPPAKVPAAITVPATDADGVFVVSWRASATVGVRYILEEATDAAFTTNLRIAYDGPNLSTQILRPTGNTYYYRIKAMKDGLAASPWVEGADGCVAGAAIGAAITVDTIALAANGADPSKPEVTFHVSYDATNEPVIGLNGYNLRFYFIALIPGTQGSPDDWKQWNYERISPNIYSVTGLPYAFGTLTDLGNGDYSYVFDMASPTAGELFTSVNRLTIRIGGSTAAGALPSSQIKNGNGFYTFNWNAVATPLSPVRYIVTTEACRDCHTNPIGHNGSSLADNTMVCVNCHNVNYNNGTFGVDRLDFTSMVHQIHSSITNPLFAGGNHDWSHVTYPQEILNCAKCHKGPEGDNWKNKPSRVACTSCHTDVTFDGVAPTHPGGPADSDQFCVGCHTAADIAGYHMTVNKTPNNPLTPAGAVNFTYVIYGVTAIPGANGTTQAVVDFAIKKDGVNMSLAAAPVGFTGGPSFLVAYALPQDGINAPADYNNRGKNAAQPANVTVASLIGTANLVPKTPGAKRYLATLASTASTFPAGATLRAVALQGYYTQKAGTNGIAADTARHTRGVVMAVAGDAVRRTVVDEAKCLKCHEIIEGHGGNRVNNPQLCVFCHVPNLSSSGRTMVLPAYLLAAYNATYNLAYQPAYDAAYAAAYATAYAAAKAKTPPATDAAADAAGIAAGIAAGETAGKAAGNAAFEAAAAPGTAAAADAAYDAALAANPPKTLAEATAAHDAVIAADATNVEAMEMFGPDSTVWPEASNNFKDMIHGIHGGSRRTYPYEFVRVRSGAAYPFDWSEVTFPGDPARCTICHKDDTFALPLDPNALSTNNQTAVNGSTNAQVATARLGANLPGDANAIISPTAAACIFCHNSDVAVAHMDALTGTINTPRVNGAVTEICGNCHGPNTWMDVKLVHGM